MDNVEYARKLLRRARSYLGMIAEIPAKCVLLRNRFRDAERRGEDATAHGDELARQLAQMEADFAKYSRKLKRIAQELRAHGFLYEVE